MNYSIFDLEYIMEVDGYKELCDKFLELAKDDEMRGKLKSILYLGGYKNYNPGSPIGRNTPAIEVSRRLSLAYLLVTNPESFDELIDSNATFFHGTRSNTIPSIIVNGINSQAKSKKEGIEVTTGEESTRRHKDRDFISFTDVLDIAEGYAGISDKSGIDTFPVVFGTTLECMKACRFKTAPSDLPEQMVINNFPTEYIKVMIVPSERVSELKDVLADSITVIGADVFSRRFYYVDSAGMVTFSESEYNKLKERLKEKNQRSNYEPGKTI